MKEWIKEHKILSIFISLVVITFVFVGLSPEDSNQIDLTGKVVEESIQKTPEKTEINEQQINDKKQPQEPEKQSNYFKVTYVVDGDTLEINTGERVRLICIDTPERGEYYYTEAKEYLKDLILDREVFLEKDKSETDRYGRLLRYVYYAEDNYDSNLIFVNEEMVREGYAEAYPYNPDIILCPQIQEAENKAKEEGLGIWATQTITEEVPSSSQNSGSSNCGSNIYNCGDFSSCSEVMEIFNSCSYDVNKLDGDADGIPCESLCG